MIPMQAVDCAFWTNRSIAGETVICQLLVGMVSTGVGRLMLQCFFAACVTRLGYRGRTSLVQFRTPTLLKFRSPAILISPAIVPWRISSPLRFPMIFIPISRRLCNFIIPLLDSTIQSLQLNNTRFIQFCLLPTFRTRINLKLSQKIQENYVVNSTHIEQLHN